MLEFFLDLSLRCVPPVIDDKDIFHVRFKSICEFARMSGMWQIRITSCLILEGQQESVSESIIEFFRTVICPPLKINDRVDFFGQGGKRTGNALNLLLRGPFVE